MMNEARRNKIEEICESLTRDEAIELFKMLLVENETLKRLCDESCHLVTTIYESVGSFLSCNYDD